MELDDALAGLPTGTRDELCIKALVQALDNIDALKQPPTNSDPIKAAPPAPLGAHHQ